MAGHIVVVEDDAYFRELLSIQISDLGHLVTAFEDGRQAREKIGTLKPSADLVLLDLLLPHVSGTEVLHFIRENEKIKHMPVVILTGLKDEKMIKTCLKMGVKDFLLKPISEKLLTQRLGYLDLNLGSNDARLIVSKCTTPSPAVFESLTFRRFRNKGYVPYRLIEKSHTFIVLCDQSFRPEQLLKLDEEMLSSHIRIYLDEAPWVPVWPMFQPDSKEMRPLDEDTLRKSLGNELFELVNDLSSNVTSEHSGRN